MPRRRPIRRILKWTGLVVCVLILSVWGLSLRWALGYDGVGWSAGFSVGGSWVHICPQSPENNWRAVTLNQWFRDSWRWGFRLPYYRSITSSGTTKTSVEVPLWIPLAIVAIPTAILFYRDRRRIPPGHCEKCGYDLTGNESGRCSECGQPTSAEHIEPGDVGR